MINDIPFLYDRAWKIHEIHYNENHGSKFISDETIKTDQFILPALVFEESDGSHSLRLNSFLLTPHFNREFDFNLRKNLKKAETAIDMLKPIASKFGIESSIVNQFQLQSIKYPVPILDRVCDSVIFRKRAFVDLTLDSQDIKRNFRKSYKQFVNKNRKINYFYCAISDCDFGLFVDRHFELAGRKTKPDICWDILKSFIDNEKALLVKCNRDFIYFFVSKDYSYYAISGAETRNDGITHSLMWAGILKLKELNSSLLDLGTVYQKNLIGDLLSNSEANDFNKIRQIGFFKSGFSNITRHDYYMKMIW